MTLTPSERRGALVLLAIFALGAARDLWETRAGARVSPAADAAPPPAVLLAGAAESAPPLDATGEVAAAVRPVRPAEPIDLNRASAVELDELPGVGPVLAERIVAYRREHGPFRAPEELLAVRGVGPKSFARMRQRLRVGDAGETSGAPPPGVIARPSGRGGDHPRR